MKDRGINKKKRVLEVLRDLDGDITLSQIREAFTEDISNYEDIINNEEKKLIEKYTDSYLFRRCQNPILGEHIEIFNIKTIKFEAYSTEFDKVYKATGTRILFSKDETRLTDNLEYYSFCKDSLENCNIITKEDFDTLINKHNRISEQLGTIMNFPFANNK